MGSVPRVLVITGLLLIAASAVVFIWQRLGGNGRLPGDIVVQRKNFTFYFPVVTSIALSAVLSLLFYLFRRFIK